MAMTPQQASNLYNDQRATTAQTIADILAQGDALKGDAQGRISGGTQGYYAGGTPGYMVDNRGAVNSQYNGIRDDVANLFGQAISQITARAPQIQTDAANRINLIGNLVNSQNQAAQGAAAQQVADQKRAAAAMGIDAAPQTARAAGTAAALTDYRNTGATAQKNYFGTIRDTALSRNQAQADAFGYNRDQRQQAIEQARQQALAKAVYWVPGSRGKFVRTYGSAEKKADKSLISAITKEQKAITKAQTAEDKQRAKDPSIRQSAVQANRRLN